MLLGLKDLPSPVLTVHFLGDKQGWKTEALSWSWASEERAGARGVFFTEAERGELGQTIPGGLCVVPPVGGPGWVPALSPSCHTSLMRSEKKPASCGGWGGHSAERA